MIILHNHSDAESRQFLINILSTSLDSIPWANGKAVFGGHTLYNWYQGGRETWIAEGHTREVSAFPSVVWDVPEYDEPEYTLLSGETVPQRRIPIHQDVHRKPSDITSVQERVDAINVRLANSANATPANPVSQISGP
jgi:hypothetical protein